MKELSYRVYTNATSRSGSHFVREMMESWGCFVDKQFENVSPSEVRLEAKTSQHMIVVITRDFLNWLASYVKWQEEAPWVKHRDCGWYNMEVKAWLDITKEVLGLTNFFMHKHAVIYDEFRDNEDVRKALCDSVGGTYSEKNIDVVASGSGGSSFDKKTKKGREMTTDQRWLQILDSKHKPIYEEILKQNPEAIKFYLEHFNVTEEQKQYLNNL